MKNITFEQALLELESLVRTLEEGHMPLADSVKAYERGISLKKFCEEQLNAARLKIEEVVAAQHKIEVKPFEVES